MNIARKIGTFTRKAFLTIPMLAYVTVLVLFIILVVCLGLISYLAAELSELCEDAVDGPLMWCRDRLYSFYDGLINAAEEKKA